MFAKIEIFKIFSHLTNNVWQIETNGLPIFCQITQSAVTHSVANNSWHQNSDSLFGKHCLAGWPTIGHLTKRKQRLQKKKKKEEKRPEVPKRKYANQVPLTSGCFQIEKKRKKEGANKCKIKGE